MPLSIPSYDVFIVMSAESSIYREFTDDIPSSDELIVMSPPLITVVLLLCIASSGEPIIVFEFPPDRLKNRHYTLFLWLLCQDL